MANSTVSALSAASTLDGTELYYGVQSAADTKVTGAQIATLARSASTGNLGFATGAGGAVTQATSRTTGVTLNKVSGAITMNNAALADATNVKFTVTNSAVGAPDVVIVNHASAGTAGAYQAWVSAVGAGSFDVSVRNVSGGSLGEAIVLNFAVIKAVAA